MKSGHRPLLLPSLSLFLLPCILIDKLTSVLFKEPGKREKKKNWDLLMKIFFCYYYCKFHTTLKYLNLLIVWCPKQIIYLDVVSRNSSVYLMHSVQKLLNSLEYVQKCVILEFINC